MTLKMNWEYNLGLFLIFTAGFRFFALMFMILAWDYMILVLFEKTPTWLGNQMVLGLGLFEIFVLFLLGKYFIDKAKVET